MTVNNHNLFEVVSALQKAVRRGNVDDALYWAVDMDLSGYADYCWRRLVVMASEDIGLANPDAVPVIYALHEHYDEMVGKSPKHRPERLFLVHAVLYLTTSPKSRIVDNALIQHYAEHDRLRREIPDYAFDKHTQRGRAKKRGVEHFFEVGAMVHPYPGEAEHELITMVEAGHDPYADGAKRVLNEGRQLQAGPERKAKRGAKGCEHSKDRETCIICANEEEA